MDVMREGRKWSEPCGSVQGGPGPVSMCVQGKQVTLTPKHIHSTTTQSRAHTLAPPPSSSHTAPHTYTLPTQ